MFEPGHTPPPARRAPVGTAGRVREALVALTEGHGQVLRQSERPWASVTFEGARHAFDLAFSGPQAVAAGESFIDGLPDHEFAIPGQLVAEATVTAVDHTLAPEPRMVVTCELLLLKDA
ncbi:hypothetical protein A6F68_01809 [Tsuneonella dongtanensis]|uniref:Uncharacterized protein n=1 Tax=Tsuneonella dongtanensis TaxID=692370 RepID=A0A1B2ADU0_9SPHN|nr:hypothetical protein [Tsuneonella dongtanensis]ANY20319.1 hypothetical protein A6F68_01809 [Tsuneonella dongtanensis]